MFRKNKEFLINLEGKSKHVLFTGVSMEKMKEVQAFLKNNSTFVSCFVSFGKKDEKLLQKLLDNCKNVFQEDLIIRAFVHTKVFNQIVSSSKISDSRGIVKNNKVCLSLLKNKDFSSIIENLNAFPTLSDVVQQQEINGNFDMSFFLENTPTAFSLQKGINDYFTDSNPMGLKVFTSDFVLTTSKTTLDSYISCFDGDYELDTSLTSIKCK